MKRAAVILGMVTLVITSVAVRADAQDSGKTAQQNPPAAGQAAPAPGATQGAATQATAPAGKRPPQLKTKPEQDAYNTAAANTDVAALEKASDDFASKFPDSEVRVLLY